MRRHAAWAAILLTLLLLVSVGKSLYQNRVAQMTVDRLCALTLDQNVGGFSEERGRIFDAYFLIPNTDDDEASEQVGFGEFGCINSVDKIRIYTLFQFTPWEDSTCEATIMARPALFTINQFLVSLSAIHREDVSIPKNNHSRTSPAVFYGQCQWKICGFRSNREFPGRLSVNGNPRTALDLHFVKLALGRTGQVVQIADSFGQLRCISGVSVSQIGYCQRPDTDQQRKPLIDSQAAKKAEGFAALLASIAIGSVSGAFCIGCFGGAAFGYSASVRFNFLIYALSIGAIAFWLLSHLAAPLLN